MAVSRVKYLQSIHLIYLKSWKKLSSWEEENNVIDRFMIEILLNEIYHKTDIIRQDPANFFKTIFHLEHISNIL